MDQATDPVTGRPIGRPADHTAHSDNPRAIAGDIRETRAELDDTLDALGRKLDPSNLIDQAKDAFTSSARDAGAGVIDQVRNSGIVDTIKENPIPAMAVGLSVAWLLSQSSDSERARRERAYYGGAYVPPPGRGYRERYITDGSEAGGDGSTLDAARDTAGDALSTAQDKASGAVESVTSTASDLADRAGDALSGAADQAHGGMQQAGQSVRQFERRAESWLERQLQENPLAVGAVALAAGALVGLSVPETDAEHRAFGETAQQARQQLAEVAGEATDQVKSAAQTVADEAADKAKAVGKEAEAKAKDVGETASDRADAVADAAKPGSTGSGSTGSGSTGSGSTGTGSSIDLSTTTGGTGTTAPPVGLGRPAKTVDLTDDDRTPSV